MLLEFLSSTELSQLIPARADNEEDYIEWTFCFEESSAIAPAECLLRFE